jgi:hypothetical protein
MKTPFVVVPNERLFTTFYILLQAILIDMGWKA